MTETIRLTYISGDVEYRSEVIREHIPLDELTWEWLKDAFVAIGFDADKVKEFFNESDGGEK